MSATEGDNAISDESVILINLLKVKPEKRDALIALLKLPGCKTTRLTTRLTRGEGRGGDRKPRRFPSPAAPRP